MTHRRPSVAFVGACSVLVAGCAGHAPNVSIIGSFFPVWMVCLAIAVALTFLAHTLLVKFRLDTEVGPVALFYPCVVLLFTSLLWLIFFR